MVSIHRIQKINFTNISNGSILLLEFFHFKIEDIMKQIKYIAMLPLIFTSLSFASGYQFSTVEEMQYVSLPAFSSIGVEYHLDSEHNTFQVLQK